MEVDGIKSRSGECWYYLSTRYIYFYRYDQVPVLVCENAECVVSFFW